MEIHKGSYYSWLKNRDTITQHDQDRKDLEPLITEIHEKYPSFGYPTIASIIRSKHGWAISDNLVHKVCKFLGIKSKTKRYRKYSKNGNEHKLFPNIINGDWKASKPFEKIVSDMTVLKHRGTKYEVTFYFDIFNRSILSFASSRRRGDNRPYYDGLYKVLDKLKGINDPSILHTDQGSVYSSLAFENAHQNYNIIRSMSRAGTPTDNPIIESFNGWMKSEIELNYNINDWETIDDFLDHYMHFYNDERPAYALQYKTPNQFLIDSRF